MTTWGDVLRHWFGLANLLPLITIGLGVAASAGLTDRWYPPDKVLVALVTMVAAQLLVERLGILTTIHDKVVHTSRERTIELLPRTDPRFERFSDFCKGATEVFVAGIDLGFMANADAWFVKDSLANGVDLKLLLINPATSEDLRDAVNRHDERNDDPRHPVHDHASAARATVETIKSLVTAGARGRVEVRARVDIPNPTLTLVNPTKRDGRIRVELKLYKRNHGDVPYFILTRSSSWYEAFLEHYYTQLWNDSAVLYTSQIDQLTRR